MGGGKAVNLVVSEKPQDVYSAVAAIVDATVKRDALAGRSEASKVLARNSGGIDRKLIKQTVCGCLVYVG